MNHDELRAMAERYAREGVCPDIDVYHDAHELGRAVLALLDENARLKKHTAIMRDAIESGIKAGVGDYSRVMLEDPELMFDAALENWKEECEAIRAENEALREYAPPDWTMAEAQAKLDRMSGVSDAMRGIDDALKPLPPLFPLIPPK